MDVDKELIRAAQSGDRDALIQLLREIEKSVYKTAYYMLGNEQDAMDASQEALIRIYTKIDTYQEKAKFTTWVQRIVTNICIDRMRRNKETTSIEDHAWMLESDDHVEREVEQYDLADHVRRAIEKLPHNQRVIVTLRYLHDMSYQEIAESLDIPLNTVKSYLFRARVKLQEWLHEYEKGGVQG